MKGMRDACLNLSAVRVVWAAYSAPAGHLQRTRRRSSKIVPQPEYRLPFAQDRLIRLCGSTVAVRQTREPFSYWPGCPAGVSQKGMPLSVSQTGQSVPRLAVGTLQIERV